MIEFDYGKLSDKERKLYDTLTDAQKKTFEKNWIGVEKQKAKTKQAKARLTKMAHAQATKERKERTHHLIEVGGVVEKFVHIDDLKEFEKYIEKYRGAILNTQIHKKAEAIAMQNSKREPAAAPTFDIDGITADKPLDNDTSSEFFT